MERKSDQPANHVQVAAGLSLKDALAVKEGNQGGMPSARCLDTIVSRHDYVSLALLVLSLLATNNFLLEMKGA